MNIVDYVVLGVLGASILFGLYRGFVSTVLNTGGCLAAIAAAFWLCPKLAGFVQGNQELQRTLLTYTDASNRIGDLATSITSVTQLTAEKIGDIVSKASLPPPLDSLLQFNLQNKVYEGVTAAEDTVRFYVSQSVLTACINIICFLLCFAAAYLVVSMLVNLLRAVFRFPVLKQLDGLAGGVFGLLRGLVLCYALFAVVPMVLTMVPIDMVSKLMAESTLAPLFDNGYLVTAIMNGSLF